MPDLRSIVDFFSRKRQEKFLTNADDKALFIEKYKAFRQVLKSNNKALLLMADMQEKSQGGFIFDSVYIHSSYDEISGEVRQLIDNLNLLSDGKYDRLLNAYRQINAVIRTKMTKRITIPETDYVLPIQAIGKDRITEAGGKFAHLGELKNCLNLPVPEGFVVTTYAYKIFSQYNQVESFLMERAQDFYSRRYEKIESLCREVQQLVINGTFPQDLENCILNAYDLLRQQVNQTDLKVAVRSSALHEDTLASFAGQYQSALSVPGDEILVKYKEIVASQFTPRALFYYRNKGFAIEEMAMAIGVLAMVPVKSSGILYSRDPKNFHEDTVLVNAVWGLGPYAVEGRVQTAVYRVNQLKTVTSDDTVCQDVMLIQDPSSGTKEVAVPDAYRAVPCLNEIQLIQMADLARQAERHFDSPQDMEWALDQKDRLYFLQSRPLRYPMLKTAVDRRRPVVVKGRTILIDKGTVVCRGAASGPVQVLLKIEDSTGFEDGSVLVIRHSHPEFAAILPKAAALISDIGTNLGHLATVAREYHIPSIFNTGAATQMLKNGMQVTVDAVFGIIYEGRVEEVLNESWREADFISSSVMTQLKDIMVSITPLNLSDPRSPDFVPENCKTLHDITRFAHEVSLRSIFELTKESHFADQSAKELISDLPLKWWVIDLEEGVDSRIKGKKVTPEQFLSIPMKALWAGMVAKPWKGPPPVSAKGFLEATFSESTDQELDRRLVDRNYILAARHYCNVSTRLGFHFSTVEAYVGEEENLNYISLFYTGGGADPARRSRRADLIAKLLEFFDFRVEKKDDTVVARLEGHSQAFLDARLKILGHTMIHTRQMDMVMYNDAVVDFYYKEMSRVLKSFLKSG